MLEVDDYFTTGWSLELDLSIAAALRCLDTRNPHGAL